MRASVWWSAAALALLAVTSALRTTQVEGISRTGRRLSTAITPDVESSTEADQVENVQYTIRPRNSRRRNETPPRDVRTRTQSRGPPSRTETVTETARTQSQDVRSERYESRRTAGRTRTKPVENTASTTLVTPSRRNNVARGRVRSNPSPTPSSSTLIPSSTSSLPSDITSSTDSKVGLNSQLDDQKLRSNAADQFKRRSSTSETIETVVPKRIRGRINTRPNARSLDLDVSGTTNSLSNLDKVPTTAKTSSDIRNSRKLRYKTRLSETDTNLTGEGIKVTNEVIKSSQKDENITSQQENPTTVPVVIASTESTTINQLNTEASPTKETTPKFTKVVRRPISRGKANFRPVASLPKKSTTDEINEDDNYPESFKALIQAKNASTQLSSPSGESLTLKGSQKIYKTYTTPSQSTNIGLATNKYSRYRNKLNAQEDSKKEDKDDNNITTVAPEVPRQKKSDYRPRATFNPRSRKLTSFSPSATSTTATLSQSTTKPPYKFNRKLKITTTKSPESDKSKTDTNPTNNLLRRSSSRPSYLARKKINSKNITNIENKEVVQKVDNKIDDTGSTVAKNLPRTSYYSRLRNNKKITTTTTAIPKEISNDIGSIEKKGEDTLDMPLIYTLLKKPSDIEIATEPDKKSDKEMLVIAVSSKEFEEAKSTNDILNTAEESEIKMVVNESPTTLKYHSIYKENEATNKPDTVEGTTQSASTATVVRNIHTRKYSPKIINAPNADVESKVTTRSRERNSRKYSESFSKTTEASTNGPSTVTENVKISTTISPRRTTVRNIEPVTLTARRIPVTRVAVTTDMPSTSTFSVQEDLAFLKNLKSVLKTNPNNDDPEVSLANRIIALAVEKSLNEIETGTPPDATRTGKNIGNNVNNVIPTAIPRPTTTTQRTTTTTTTTTTTPRSTTTVTSNLPSLEDDIKQFQEDTKLLQALIKATGQDPSKFNIPTLPNLTANIKVSQKPTNAGLKVAKPTSPLSLNKPSVSLSSKSKINSQTKSTNADSTKPFGAKIAVKDDLKTIQDDANLLKTLVKLQDVQETTTQRNKLTITGQTSDEALKKLLQQQNKQKGMVSEATQAPMSLSTEFGKSNDALLAALLKEQGFGPTTASSLDEQLRLSALLNQVVVTPKARRTTTPPPPPQQRRPILDGLAWLWQQWRDTAPGPTPPRPSRRPSPAANPTVSSSAATSNRVNWFGSGPFVGNADDQPPPNRIPLEPPRAVTSEQTPGRGQLVSAAINVTRAFSQFLGAAIQGAAQTVQNVIRAGQKVATDVYVSGSGGSGASG